MVVWSPVVLAVLEQLSPQALEALGQLADRVIPARAPADLQSEFESGPGRLHSDMLPELGNMEVEPQMDEG